MLYIENIDDNSIRFGNAAGGGDAPRVLPKTLIAELHTNDRITIRNKESGEYVLHHGLYDEINLDGVVYANPTLFVVMFNNSMGGSISGDVSSGGVFNTPSAGEVINSTKLFVSGSIHSISVVCVVGTAVVTIGTDEINMSTGESFSIEASGFIDKNIEIDTTAGATNEVDYVVIGSSLSATTTVAVTTTTTVAVTTTTTI